MRGRLRDICISPDGKIYLATNGNNWPSQGPNEIIELYNPDFDYSSIQENNAYNNIKQTIDLLGRQVSESNYGLILIFMKMA